MTDNDRLRALEETVRSICVGYAINYAKVYPSDDDELLIASKTDEADAAIQALIAREVRLGKIEELKKMRKGIDELRANLTGKEKS